MLEIVYRSKKQELKFNTPRMLSHDCPDEVEQAWSIHACGFAEAKRCNICVPHAFSKGILDGEFDLFCMNNIRIPGVLAYWKKQL